MYIYTLYIYTYIYNICMDLTKHKVNDLGHLLFLLAWMPGWGTQLLAGRAV